MNEDYVAAAIACAKEHGFNAAEVKEIWENALKQDPDLPIEYLVSVTEECATVFRDREGEDADHEIKCESL
jgi:hypothetical protein